MLYLFGSWAKGEPTPTSDVDVFVETADDLDAIPVGQLLFEGGVVDAFWMAVRQFRDQSTGRLFLAPAHDVALAIDGDRYDLSAGDDRRLVVWDDWGSTVGEPIPITGATLGHLCDWQARLRAGEMTPAEAQSVVGPLRASP